MLAPVSSCSSVISAVVPPGPAAEVGGFHRIFGALPGATDQPDPVEDDTEDADQTDLVAAVGDFVTENQRLDRATLPVDGPAPGKAGADTGAVLVPLPGAQDSPAEPAETPPCPITPDAASAALAEDAVIKSQDKVLPQSPPAIGPPLIPAGELVVPDLTALAGDMGLGLPMDRPSGIMLPAGGGAPAPGENARLVAQQMAVWVMQTADKVTEIAVNPVELGRVRLQMTTADQMLLLQITAERPETADLLRRHIDILGQEFRALGFDDVSFAFAGDPPPRPRTSATFTRDDPPDAETRADQPPGKARRAAGGLDLRL